MATLSNSPIFDKTATTVINQKGELFVAFRETNVSGQVSYRLSGQMAITRVKKIGDQDKKTETCGVNSHLTTTSSTENVVKSTILSTLPAAKPGNPSILNFVQYTNLILTDLTNGVELKLQSCEKNFQPQMIAQPTIVNVGQLVSNKRSSNIRHAGSSGTIINANNNIISVKPPSVEKISEIKKIAVPTLDVPSSGKIPLKPVFENKSVTPVVTTPVVTTPVVIQPIKSLQPIKPIQPIKSLQPIKLVAPVLAGAPDKVEAAPVSAAPEKTNKIEINIPKEDVINGAQLIINFV
jgi:hypothetical protein